MTQQATQVQFIVAEEEEGLTPYQAGLEDALMELPRQAYDYFVPESTQWYAYLDGYAAGQIELEMSQDLDDLRSSKRAYIIKMSPAEHDAIERDRMVNRVGWGS